MPHPQLAPDILSLLGGGCLTWPALRAGRVLTRIAALSSGERTATSVVSRNIFRRLIAAYLADNWRPSDQRWLWIGLVLTAAGSLWAMLAKWYGVPGAG